MISLWFLIGINTFLLIILGIYTYQINKKKTIAIILNQNKTTETTKKFNPSEKKLEIGENTYILSEPPFIKYKNFRFVLYEKGNTEPLQVLKDQDDRRINADVIHQLLKMEKIKALNTPKKNIFDMINKKHIIIGVVLVVVFFLMKYSGYI